MKQNNQMTSGQIMKEILSEMSGLDIFSQLQVLCFVLRLWISRQRHKTLNVCLAVIVLGLLIFLLMNG